MSESFEIFLFSKTINVAIFNQLNLGTKFASDKATKYHSMHNVRTINNVNNKRKGKDDDLNLLLSNQYSFRSFMI